MPTPRNRNYTTRETIQPEKEKDKDKDIEKKKSNQDNIMTATSGDKVMEIALDSASFIAGRALRGRMYDAGSVGRFIVADGIYEFFVDKWFEDLMKDKGAGTGQLTTVRTSKFVGLGAMNAIVNMGAAGDMQLMDVLIDGFAVMVGTGLLESFVFTKK